jgi:hypothetical protein
MTPEIPRSAKDIEPRLSKYSDDVEVARITAKADLILEELDGVVQQLAAMLREGSR